MVDDTFKERYALLVCDCQPDLLKSLKPEARASFDETLAFVLKSARDAKWLVVWSGIRFPAGYEGLSESHRVFGGLKRLNEKVGDAQAHWLMEDYPGGDIEPAFGRREDEPLAFRSQLRNGEELLSCFRERGITKVVVVGGKASQGALTACQALVDQDSITGIYCVRDCIFDDDEASLTACLDLIFPKLADVKPWDALRVSLGEEMLIDQWVQVKMAQAASGPVIPSAPITFEQRS